MEKEPKIFRLTPLIFLLVIPLLYVDILWGNNIKFEQQLHYVSSLAAISTTITKTGVQDSNSLDSILSRLVQEEDLSKFRSTGFCCDSQIDSKHCVANGGVQIDTRSMTLTIQSNQSQQEISIRPYARQGDEALLRTVTPVKIVQSNATPPVCDHRHGVPAVVFSASGFIGNVFHEMNEIIIPLFITTRLLKSRVIFVMVDYRPSFIKKYNKILAGLSNYEVLNAAANQSVHCFPAAVVGLKFHGQLAVNSSDIPRGLSTTTLRQFLRQSLNLRYSHVSQIKRPTVMFLCRTTTRRIINVDEVVGMMEELGFKVIVVRRAPIVSNLNLFSSMINKCSVFVGAHGAGMTNEIFLPDGAVTVQVDLIGLEWAAATYYGNPARGMRVHYLRYKVEPEESSLLRIFGSARHKALTDPRGAFPIQVGREVYLNGQNVKINVERFRETMVMAMSLVQDSSL